MGRQRSTSCRGCGTTENLCEGICNKCRAAYFRERYVIRKREAWIRLMSWTPPRVA